MLLSTAESGLIACGRRSCCVCDALLPCWLVVLRSTVAVLPVAFSATAQTSLIAYQMLVVGGAASQRKVHKGDRCSAGRKACSRFCTQ
jgi:hypothetical protein